MKPEKNRIIKHIDRLENKAHEEPQSFIHEVKLHFIILILVPHIF